MIWRDVMERHLIVTSFAQMASVATLVTRTIDYGDLSRISATNIPVDDHIVRINISRDIINHSDSTYAPFKPKK